MTVFTQMLINTILIGGIYTVIASGFFVLYRSLGIINLAHGEFILIGSYIAWIFNRQLAFDPILSLLFVLPLMLVLAYIASILFLPGYRDNNLALTMLITWTVGIGLRSGFQILFTSSVRSVDSMFEVSFQIGDAILPGLRTIILVVAAILMLLLTLLFNNTRFGRQIRCVAQNVKAAEMLGLNIKRIQFYALLVSMLLVGLSGVLISPVYQISPILGQWLTIRCLAVVLLAKNRSFLFLGVSGFIVAFFEILIGTFLIGYGTGLSSLVPYIVILTSLIWEGQLREFLRIAYVRFSN